MVPEATNDDLGLGQTLRGFAAGQKLFNRYTLERQLGEGGMGVVWLAHDDQLDEQVALKFLPEKVINNPEAIEDLKYETRRSRELSHHFIVRIHDFVQNELVAGISMEYVDGRTVTELKLKQPARCFNARDLQGLVAQLCEALEYAHNVAKVVHRDLKPSNLMVNSKRQLKVTDFGIARSIADTASRLSGRTGTSGTPPYMSPQQANGEKTNPSDDIYALGATLYELLTSKPPFYSGDIVDQLKHKVPPSIAERRLELSIEGDPVPAHWEQTIAACLAKEAAQRPQGAAEVARRLLAGVQFEKGASLSRLAEAGEASPKMRSQSRKKVLVGIVAGLGVALLIGVGIWRFQNGLATQARLRPTASETAQARYVTMSIPPSSANMRFLEGLGWGMPSSYSGSGLLGGVPFDIPASGLNGWFAAKAAGPNPRTLRIPVNLPNVTEVHTLMVTAWGMLGPTSLARIEFVGTGGAYYRKDLIGGVDIRDFHQPGRANTINGTTTIEVASWDTGGGTLRLDKQQFVLPEQFRGEMLSYIQISDFGQDNLQRLALGGLTVLLGRTSPEAKAQKSDAPQDRSGWINLFDGKALSGWDTVGPAHWEIKDGELVGEGNGGPGRGSFLFGPNPYRNLEFKSDVKLSHEGNSGMFFRAVSATKTVIGYEAQIANPAGQRTPQAYTGSLYGGDGVFNAVTDVLVPDDTWFTQHVIAIGNRIVIKVNDKIVTDYTDRQKTFTSGHLALQKMRAGEVAFRNVLVKPLPDNETEAWAIAQKDMPDLAR